MILQHPCTSEIDETSPENVVHIDVIEIEHNSEKMMPVGLMYQLRMRIIWWILKNLL